MTGTPTAKELSPNQVDPLATTIGLPPTPRPTLQVGVPGFVITGGYVQTQEKDPELQGYRRYQTHQNNLLNIAIVGAGVRYFLDLVAGGAWNFEPADDSAEAKDAAEFVGNALLDSMEETPWLKVMKHASMFRFHGFSVAEWNVIPREDGRIGFAGIENRPQVTIEKWQVDPRGRVIGLWQRNPANGHWLYLPREKVLYIVDDTLQASPEGIGLFRHLVRGANGIRRFEDLEHWGFETDLQGVPIGRAPLAELQRQVDDGIITKAQAEAAVGVMRSFIENHIRGPKNGVLMDSTPYFTQDEKQTPTAQPQWAIDLLKAGGGAHESIGKAIRRKTFEIARVLGCEFLLLGEDGSGSLALAGEAKERLYNTVNSTRTELGHEVNCQLVGALCILNGIPKKLRPKAVPAHVEKRSIEEVVGALVGMAQAGAPLMPGDPAINEVRGKLGISPVEETLAELDAMLKQPVLNAINPHDVTAGSGSGSTDANEPPAAAMQKSLSALHKILRRQSETRETLAA